MKNSTIFKFLDNLISNIDCLISKRDVSNSKRDFLAIDDRNIFNYWSNFWCCWCRSLVLPLIFGVVLITGYTANAQDNSKYGNNPTHDDHPNYDHPDTDCLKAVCSGESATFTASSGSSYAWTGPGDFTANTASVTVKVPGVYVVTVSSDKKCKCKSICEYTLEVNDLPTALATKNLSVCNLIKFLKLRDAILDPIPVGVNVSFWKDAAATQPVLDPDNFPVLVSGTLTLYIKLINAAKCPRIQPFSITVNPLPSCDIKGDNEICEGSSTTFTATGGSSYSWKGPDGYTVETASITISKAGTYTVTVTNENGCSKECSRKLIVNPTPKCDITGEKTFCEGGSTYLTATGGGNYHWTGPEGFEAYTDKIKVLVAGDYTVQVNNCPVHHGKDCGFKGEWNDRHIESCTCSCSCSKTVTVGINLLPTALATKNLSICTLEQIVKLRDAIKDVVVPEGVEVTFWKDAAATSQQILDPDNFPAPSSGTLTLYIKLINAAKCPRIQPFTVKVNPLPSCDIKGDNEICEGSSTTFTATGGSSYSWKGPDEYTAETASITISKAGIYTVTVTNENGCSKECSRKLIVNPTPKCDITGEKTFCEGGSTYLTATGGGNYMWTGPNGFTAYTDKIKVLVGGDYTVQVNNCPVHHGKDCGFKGEWNDRHIESCTCSCSCSKTVTVGVSPLPTALAAKNLSVCSVVKFLKLRDAIKDVVVPVGVDVTFWKDAGATSQQVLDPDNFPVPNVGTLLLYIKLTNAAGCVRVQPFSVKVNPLPSCDIKGDNVICEGGSTIFIAIGGKSYSWTGPDEFTASTAFIKITKAGTYTVTVTNENGCSSECSRKLIVNPAPKCDITGEKTFCEGGSTYLTATGGGNYFWIGPNGFIAFTDKIKVTAKGDYTVFVNNCSVHHGKDCGFKGEWDDKHIEGCTCFCFCSKTVTVGVDALPTALSIKNLSVCSLVKLINLRDVLKDVTIPAGIDVSFWKDALATQSVGDPENFPAPISGTLTLYIKLINAAKCPRIQPFSVTVNPLPSCDIKGENLICEGSSATFTASGAGVDGAYSWKLDTDPNYTASTASITVSKAGIYTVTVTNKMSKCSNTCFRKLSFKPTPVCDITGEKTFCEDGSTYLTATGGGNYMWTGPGGFTAYTDKIKVTVAGAYTVKVNNCPIHHGSECGYNGEFNDRHIESCSCSCSCTKTVTVGVDTLPTALSIKNLSVCSLVKLINLRDALKDVTIPAGIDVSFWKDALATQSVGDPENFPSPTSGTLTLYIKLINAAKCPRIQPFSVTVNPLPSCDIKGENLICEGSSTTFTASGAGVDGAYSWKLDTDPNYTASTASITVSKAGIYTVTVTNKMSKCSNTCFRKLSFKPTPVCDITGDKSFCEGGSTYLTASGGGNYLWTGPGGFTAYTDKIKVTVAGEYTVVVNSCPVHHGSECGYHGEFNDRHIESCSCSCSCTKIVTVGVDTLPTALSIKNLSVCSLVKLINLRDVLKDVTIPAGIDVSFWKDALATQSVGDPENFPSPTSSTLTLYIKLINAAKCPRIQPFSVTVNPLPSCDIKGESLICEGSSTTFTASGAGVDGTYSWKLDTDPNYTASTASITVSKAGIYTVTVTNKASKCSSTCFRKLSFKPTPVCDITGDKSFCEGGSTYLTASGGGNYLWTGPGGFTAYTDKIKVTVAGEYTVVVNSCPVHHGSECGYHGEFNDRYIQGCSCSCSCTKTVIIGVNPLPTALAVKNLSVCTLVNFLKLRDALKDVVVPVGIDVTFWKDQAVTSQQILDPDNFPIPNIGTLVLYIKLTNAAGCVRVQPFSVTVNPLPVCKIETDKTGCKGSEVNFTASGGTSYSWTGPNNFSAKIATISHQTRPGEYCVTVTNASGCTSTCCVTIPETPEGCTLGYWKNHTDRWCSNYTTCMTIGEVFDNEPSNFTNLTLLQALNLGGGGVFNLARQGVAALLNTCSDDVNYPSPYQKDSQSVINAVNAAFLAGGNASGLLASKLDILNNSGCPLGGTSATSVSNCENEKFSRTSSATGFKASPVPFKDQLIVSYNFDFVTDVKIEIFNSKGDVVASSYDTNGYLNKSVTLYIPYASIEQEAVYVVKATTNKGSSTKKILSSTFR